MQKPKPTIPKPNISLKAIAFVESDLKMNPEIDSQVFQTLDRIMILFRAALNQFWPTCLGTKLPKMN